MLYSKKIIILAFTSKRKQETLFRSWKKGFMQENMSNREIIELYFQSINKKEFETAFELLSEDLDWWILGNTKSSGNYTKRTISIGFKLLFKNFENFSFITKEFTSEEDRISVIAESKGVKKSSKKYYNNQYHFLFYIKNNKILKVKEFLDTEHARYIEED